MIDDNHVAAILHNALARFQTQERELGQLDAAAGDGDHGATMVRGLAAAVAAVDAQGRSSSGDLLVAAGDAFADAAGGASGALLGAFFCTVGRKLPGAAPSPTAVSAALDAGLATVARLGKAAPGDKTLLDALAPFVQEFAAAVERGETTANAWRAALPAAAQGAAATAAMIARRGRASRLGERSRGHIDPGAQSVVYLLAAVDEVLQTA
jgi:dihydroxyacetone kinase-like protein